MLADSQTCCAWSSLPCTARVCDVRVVRGKRLQLFLSDLTADRRTLSVQLKEKSSNNEPAQRTRKRLRQTLSNLHRHLVQFPPLKSAKIPYFTRTSLCVRRGRPPGDTTAAIDDSRHRLQACDYPRTPAPETWYIACKFCGLFCPGKAAILPDGA